MLSMLLSYDGSFLKFCSAYSVLYSIMLHATCTISFFFFFYQKALVSACGSIHFLLTSAVLPSKCDV